MFYLEILYLLCNFVGKFTNFIWNMQTKREEFTTMGLMSYYNSLTSKEKVKLKTFVAQLIDRSYFTVDAKFRGKSNFSAAELIALQPYITQESWRQ